MLPTPIPAIDPTILPGTPAATPLSPGDYQPTEDEQKAISDTKTKMEAFRRIRLPHEQQWFINSGMMRGQHYIEYNVREQRLIVNAPTARERHAINRLRAKVLGRRSKFLKSKMKVSIVPSTSEQSDRMNARATNRAIDYFWRKQQMNRKMRHVVMQAEVGAKGYLWVYWDSSRIVQGVQEDPVTGEKVRVEAMLGDVCVEVGSPYEVLVADPTIPTLAGQPEIMRIKMRMVEDVKGRYPEFAPFITGEAGNDDLFRYERQIASLNATGYGASAYNEARDRGKGQGKGKDYVLVIEHFFAPTGDHPKGRYRVVVGNVLVKNEDSLPYGFYDLPNPYPVEEHIDSPNPNQFYGTTLVEQLIPLQREYNAGRAKLAEHIKLNVHPKIIVFKQHRMPQGAWHSGAGEIIELFYMPGLPPPIVVHPPNITGDLWRALDTIRGEFEDISQVYPAAEGKTGGATSGFQTNLLQEAADGVHRPDVEGLEDMVTALLIKVRRLMKIGYTAPRMVSAIGANLEPDVEEFLGSQVDEAADIVVMAGGALPDLRAQKLQMLKEMYDGQLLGPVGSPEASRKFFSLADMGGVGDQLDSTKVDENMARVENNDFLKGRPVKNPEFFEAHDIHYQTHTELLKSPETRNWPPEQRIGILLHVIGHLDYINPMAALEAAVQYGLPPPPRAMSVQQQQQQMAMEGGVEGQPSSGAPSQPVQQQPPMGSGGPVGA